jgi:PAS domain S-box-containing protein
VADVDDRQAASSADGPTAGPVCAATNDRYRQLFEDTPIGLYRSTVDGRLLDANPALVRILGYPDRETLLATPIAGTYVDPADRDRLIRLAAQERTGSYAEMQLRRFDGSPTWVRINTHVVPDVQGTPALLEGTIEDIAERKGAEAALVEAERRYRDLVQMSPDAVMVHVRGRIVFVNPAGARLFGAHDPAELIGHAVFDLVHPDSLASVRSRVAAVTERQVDAPLMVEKLRRLDGSAFLAEVAARPIAFEGEPAVHLVARDVTNRIAADEAVRRSEARFRALIETSFDTITIIDREGRILYDSPTLERVLGLPAGGRTGRLIMERVHPDDAPRLREAWQSLLADPAAPVSLRYRVLDVEGRAHFIEATARNLIDDPAVGGVVVNARDVTERVRLEEELRQAQKMEALGRLAGGVAHDFNNILTAIGGNLQLLLERLPGDDPLRPDLIEIEESAQRASALTRQLLALSRRQVLQPRVLDLNECVTRTERMLRRVIGEHIELSTDLAPDLGSVRADPGQVEQVVINLALNARDAMPSGGRLTVGTRNENVPDAPEARARRLRPGPCVVLSVSDTGRGITTEQLPHIFEPFFTTKGPGEGTGLGLSVVYSIVSQSGGAIDVATEPGRGTTFTVYLPRVEGRPAPKPARPTAAPAGSASCRRILLVEDDATVRSLAARVLTAAGHQLAVAEDGPTALRLFDSAPEPPDLLVTDIVMPGLNGWELAQTLQARRPGLKVLLISGYTREVVMPPERLEEGILFLEKPFSPEALRAAVERACGG